MLNFEKKLFGRLGEFQDAGIFDENVRKNFEVYLDKKIESQSASTRFIGKGIVYGLGVFSLILGVILLISYNWDKFEDFLRLTFGFIPLILGFSMGAYALLKAGKYKAFFSEASPLLIIAGVMTSIAVVAQVYHIEGDFSRHIFAVFSLSFLLPVIFNSAAAAIAVQILLSVLLLNFDKSLSPFSAHMVHIYLLIVGAYLFFKSMGKNANGYWDFALLLFVIFASSTSPHIFDFALGDISLQISISVLFVLPCFVLAFTAFKCGGFTRVSQWLPAIFSFGLIFATLLAIPNMLPVKNEWPRFDFNYFQRLNFVSFYAMNILICILLSIFFTARSLYASNKKIAAFAFSVLLFLIPAAMEMIKYKGLASSVYIGLAMRFRP